LLDTLFVRAIACNSVCRFSGFTKPPFHKPGIGVYKKEILF
jgi:hypothetical protein